MIKEINFLSEASNHGIKYNFIFMANVVFGIATFCHKDLYSITCKNFPTVTVLFSNNLKVKLAVKNFQICYMKIIEHIYCILIFKLHNSPKLSCFFTLTLVS
jgi:hypothetical protein